MIDPRLKDKAWRMSHLYKIRTKDGELMREERTIGELMLAKRKPSILFKLLKLFKEYDD